MPSAVAEPLDQVAISWVWPEFPVAGSQPAKISSSPSKAQTGCAPEAAPRATTFRPEPSALAV